MPSAPASLAITATLTVSLPLQYITRRLISFIPLNEGKSLHPFGECIVEFLSIPAGTAFVKIIPMKIG